MPMRLSQGLLLLVASGLLLFPGPLSSILGILLLVPPLRRGVVRVFFRSVAAAATTSSPNVYVRVVGPEGAPSTGMNPPPRSGELKPVEGTVLEDREKEPPPALEHNDDDPGKSERK